MNGPIKTESVVFDTNWVIDHLKGRQTGKPFAENERYISVVTRIELYAFPEITAKGKEDITRFLDTVTVIPLNDKVEQRSIEVRRRSHLKLPDASN